MQVTATHRVPGTAGNGALKARQDQSVPGNTVPGPLTPPGHVPNPDQRNEAAQQFSNAADLLTMAARQWSTTDQATLAPLLAQSAKLMRAALPPLRAVVPSSRSIVLARVEVSIEDIERMARMFRNHEYRGDEPWIALKIVKQSYIARQAQGELIGIGSTDF